MTVDDSILQRQSRKVLGKLPGDIADASDPHFDRVFAEVQATLGVAGMAPFHYPASDVLGGTAKEPWRCVLIHRTGCEQLHEHMYACACDGDGPADGPRAGKMFSLLNAAEALVLVYAAVEPTDGTIDESKRAQRNMEHMLATGAFVQNILLGLTKRNLYNYWSSGGILQSEQAATLMQKPENSVLAAAVFVNSPHNADQLTVKPGSWRKDRSEFAEWTTVKRAFD